MMVNACQLLLLSLLAACVGCAMCDSSMDNNYAAYGGVRDRTDRVNGRVASLFDPAAATDSLAPEGDVLDSIFVPERPEFSIDDDTDDEDAPEGSQRMDDLMRKLEELGGELREVPAEPRDLDDDV